VWCEEPYVSAGIGVPIAKKFIGRNGEPYITGSLDKIIMYTASAGYRLDDIFRLDINGQFRSFKYAEVDNFHNLDQHIKNYTVFLNGYCDVANNVLVFTPYITAGIGYSYNATGDLKNTSGSFKSNFSATGIKTYNFAYNIGVGATIDIDKNLGLDLRYRWVNMGKVKVNAAILQGHTTPTDNPSTQDLAGHELTLGIVYNFNSGKRGNHGSTAHTGNQR
jgi:opacity protein-like surface antigen